MIYSKTDAGQQVLKDRSVPMSPRQRAAFILVDGKRTAEELLKATAATGVTRDDLAQLAALGLIADTAPDRTAREAAKEQSEAHVALQHKQRTDPERYAEAYPLAVKLAAGLGLRGFRLNLAVEAATNYRELLAIAPKIRDAVGSEKYAALDSALNDR